MKRNNSRNDIKHQLAKYKSRRNLKRNDPSNGKTHKQLLFKVQLTK